MTMKPKYFIIKKVLSFFGLYCATGPESQRPQYVFLRKLYRHLGLYPNIHGKHFYYEKPNSFMAPKIYEYVNMLKITKLRKSDTVLDLGCGEGTLAFVLGKHVNHVIGVDVGEEGIAAARFKAEEIKDIVNATFYDEKLEKLKLDEGSIDKIFSFSVIEHIPNYMEVFEEIFRLIKPGGELIISVDSFSDFDLEVRQIHEKEFDVQKYFEKDELQELLENLGFETVKVKPIFKSKFAENWFIRVMKDPGEYFGLLKRLYSVMVYLKLIFHERKVIQNERGIFLLARCVKPK